MRRAESYFRFWGWNSQGDWGPWTFYTDQRKGLVYFLKAPPLEPASAWQQSIRNSFRLAAYAWRSIDPDKQADWERAAQRAHLRCTGYNVFTYWSLTHDDAAIHTIERQTGIQLIPLQTRTP